MYFHARVPSDVGGHLPCWGTYPTLNQKTMVATSHSGRRWLCYAAAGEYALGVTEISGA